MKYLKTKKQFESLSVQDKRIIKEVLEIIRPTQIWVSIILNNPPKGIRTSHVFQIRAWTSHQMSEYVRVNSKIVKQSIEITKLKTWAS
jgi:hypothetical protein